VGRRVRAAILNVGAGGVQKVGMFGRERVRAALSVLVGRRVRAAVSTMRRGRGVRVAMLGVGVARWIPPRGSELKILMIIVAVSIEL
jgi:hypothetical protein